jgi:CubicO group peptidase (beta-lactamase class C family)
VLDSSVAHDAVASDAGGILDVAIDNSAPPANDASAASAVDANRGAGGSGATDGSVATGGIVSAGGGSGVGGALGTGGAGATGGAPSTGGTKATGGAIATGGVPSTGGVGGAPNTGGSGPCQVVGTVNAAYQAADSSVVSFLAAQGVANAEFALSKSGTTLVTRAYTCPGAIGAPTDTTTMFRLASNSKAWTSAAIYNLIQQGTITLSTKAFNYLGITTPLPSSATVDSRVFDVTVGNLIDHKSGWDDTVAPYFDPTHAMRDIALNLGLSVSINKQQMAQYMLGQPLQEAPGTTYAYCNFCYVVLGMVVEKATGMAFGDYITQHVASPIGVANVAVSPTLEPRLAGEVSHYFSPYTGTSAVNVTSTALVPGPNGGDGLIREVDAPAGGLATSAESMLKLMDHYLIWGVGPAPGPGYTWAREGSDEGTNTWAEQRGDGKRWSLLVNTRNFSPSMAFDTFASQMDALLDSLP